MNIGNIYLVKSDDDFCFSIHLLNWSHQNSCMLCEFGYITINKLEGIMLYFHLLFNDSVVFCKFKQKFTSGLYLHIVHKMHCGVHIFFLWWKNYFILTFWNQRLKILNSFHTRVCKYNFFLTCYKIRKIKNTLLKSMCWFVQYAFLKFVCYDFYVIDLIFCWFEVVAMVL